MLHLTQGQRGSGGARQAGTTGTNVSVPSSLQDGRITIQGRRDHHTFFRVWLRTYQGEVAFDFIAAEVPTGLLIAIQEDGGPMRWERADTMTAVLRGCWTLARMMTAARHPGDVHRQVQADFAAALPADPPV